MQMLTRPAKTLEQHPVQRGQRQIDRDVDSPHDQRAQTPDNHPQTNARHTTIILAMSTLPRSVTLSKTSGYVPQHRDPYLGYVILAAGRLR